MERRELEAKLIANPDNADAFLVYADYLQTQGDPRGELIMLHHTGKMDEAKDYLEQHKEVLLGPLANYRTTFDGEAADAFEWRLGFIRSARLSYDSNCVDDVEVELEEGEEVSLVGAVEAVLTHPSGMLLEEIVIPINMLDDGCYFEPVLQAIAKHGAPMLKRLRVGEYQHAGPKVNDSDYSYEVSWAGVGDLSALWKAVPKLERLVIQSGLGSSSLGSPDSLGAVDLPNLRHLEIISGGISGENLRALANAKWPSLTYMDLWLGSSNYGFDGAASDLEPIFDAVSVPKLAHLGLMNAEITDEICARLATAKITAQLEELSLAHGMMSNDGAAALLKAKPALKKLKRLILDNNYLSQADAASLADVCAGVSIGEQRDGDPDDRYVALAE